MRVLYMGGADLCIPVRDGETQEEAEDRLIDLLDSVGVYLFGWNAGLTEIEDVADDDYGLLEAVNEIMNGGGNYDA